MASLMLAFSLDEIAENALQIARDTYQKYSQSRMGPNRQNLGVISYYRLLAADMYDVANDACLEAGRDIDAAQCRVNAAQLRLNPGDLLSRSEVRRLSQR